MRPNLRVHMSLETHRHPYANTSSFGTVQYSTVQNRQWICEILAWLNFHIAHITLALIMFCNFHFRFSCFCAFSLVFFSFSIRCREWLPPSSLTLSSHLIGALFCMCRLPFTLLIAVIVIKHLDVLKERNILGVLQHAIVCFILYHRITSHHITPYHIISHRIQKPRFLCMYMSVDFVFKAQNKLKEITLLFPIAMPTQKHDCCAKKIYVK